MEFSKLKSKYQRSFPSVFSLTKKSTLLCSQKQVLISSFNNLIKYFEYFIFNWKLFCLSIKKNYLFQLITLKEKNHFFVHNDFFLFFKKLKNSRSTVLLFFNIPFLFSFIISEIFESIIKKTIYLYRFVLLLSIPLLIFCVNKNFILQNKKESLSFLLPDNKKICWRTSENYQDQQNSFYIKNLRKIILRNHILKFISQKLKNFNSQKQNFSYFFEEKKAYSSYLPNFSKQLQFKAYIPSRIFFDTQKNMIEGGKFNKLVFFNQFPYKNIQNLGEITKNTDQKSRIFSKWFFLYLNLKKNYKIKFPTNYNYSIQEKKIKNVCGWSYDQIIKYNSNYTFFNFFELCQFSKKNKYLTQEFFVKIDSFLFSLIKPRDLNYLSNFPVRILSNRHFVNLNFLEGQNEQLNTKTLILEETTNSYPEKRTKNKKLLQNITKQQWILTIREWSKLYPSQNKFSYFLKNKQKLKENFQLFQNLNFIINLFKNLNSFWTPFGQIFFSKLLVHKGYLSSIFVNSQQSFAFTSYKKALNLKKFFLGVPSEQSSLSLANFETLNSYLKSFPFYLNSTKNRYVFQKINYLYNFSFHFNKDYIFLNPETVLLINNTCVKPFSIFSPTNVSILEEGPSDNLQSSLINNQNFYDLDFYWSNYKPNDDLFWISSSSLSLRDFKEQKTILEQEKKNQKKIFYNSAQTSEFTFFQKNFNLIQKKREKLQNSIIFSKLHFLKKYNKWIFTPQWWLFFQNGLLIESQSFIENITHNTQFLIYQISNKLINTNKKDFLYLQNLKKISKIVVFQVQNWNQLLVDRIDTSQQEKSLWINLKLLSSVNNSLWSFFTWFIASSIVYYHWLPMLTGFIYLYLWLDFEKIRSLSYPSWKVFLSILTHNSFDSPSQQLRLSGYLSRGRLFFIYSKFYTLSNEIFFIFNRLNSLTTLDLSRRNKNLVSNSFITKKTLTSKYFFWNLNKQTARSSIRKNLVLNGFNFFQKWYEKNFRISFFLQKNVLKSFSLTWLNDLFFYNKFLIYDVNNQINSISINSKSKPISLLESITYTQRWLFIGSLESGKSFVIKNLAASMYYPLIHISIKDLKNATPDSKYTKIRKQKRWVEQLSERSFFLDNIFNLAKIVAPSIFWISDLHDFETKNQGAPAAKNTQKFDISLLMATILKILSFDPNGPEKQNHITFIGSTEYPRLLDPKFVSRQRLDLIVNFRTPSFNQRQSIFTFLLKTKGFTIKGLRSVYELNSNTLGYTFRDITSLVNETLLIKTKENTTVIDSNTIRLALYRQTSTQSVKYKILRQENLHYKIGKALVQAILVYPKSIMFLSKYHDLWKTKFYYLSNTYLEVSSKKTITTEFVLLTQILNCLAGSAARDAWIFSTRISDIEHTGSVGLVLTSQLKHDFSLASNILQSLLVEFSMRDITCLSPKKKKNRKDILKTFHFNFLKRALSYLECFAPNGPSYINWSIKGKRLSFNWVLFFSGIEYSTKNLTRFLFLDKNKKNIFSPLLEKSIDINIPYERRETKRQQQKIQKIDSLFNKMIYTMYMENLGFPWESEYVMDYNPFQFSLFFREARPLWNPQTIMPSYSILFFDRDLLINQKMLTKLYITYGNKFQIEKLNRKRIKKQFFWSNFAFQKVDLNNISEIKKDFSNPGGSFGSRGIHSSDFHFYQNLINLNAQLDQSQIQLPVYLHQGWITADPNETFRTFDILSTKILVNNDHLISKESFLFEILLEIYHYLLIFFIKNKSIMIDIKEILLKNEILYRQDIENVMKKYYKIY